MPNIKSAIKRMHTSQERNKKNSAQKSALKTVLKKTVTAIETKKKNEAETLIKSAFSAIDRACKKNLLHKNNAARKKSQLATKLNKIAV